MRVDNYVGDFLAIKIEKTKPSRSFDALSQLLGSGITHDHGLAASVITNIVSVVRELYRRENLEPGSIEDLCNTVEAARNEQTVSGRVIEHPLWLSQICNRVNSPP